jgi:hypothetical protein
LYHYRNRTYSPTLGRFLQRDSNETALPLLAAAAFHGEIVGGDGVGLDIRNHYGDGMNLYEFLGSNPPGRGDSLGLSWNDSFDEFDDLEADLIGHRLYALGALNEGARIASLGLQTVLDIGGALLGLDIIEAVRDLHSGQGGFQEAIDIALAVTPIGKIGKIGGKFAKLLKYRRLAKGAVTTADVVTDLVKVSGRWKKGYNRAKMAEATAKYAGKAGKREWHHIIPKYLLPPNFDMSKVPTVQVDAAYHQLITNEFRKAWRYARPGEARIPPSPERLEGILEQVYAILPLPID